MFQVATESNRKDEDIISMAAFKVTLGEKEYKIKPLRITPQREWREFLVKHMTDVTQKMKEDTGSDDAFLSGLGFTLLRFPEKLADLVFAYAPNLPRKEIEDEATEEQLARVFGQIMEIAYPFKQELRIISQVLGVAANFQQ